MVAGTGEDEEPRRDEMKYASPFHLMTEGSLAAGSPRYTPCSAPVESPNESTFMPMLRSMET